MIKRLLFLLISAASLWGAQSVSVSSGAPSVTLAGSPWTTFGSQAWRAELRIHSWDLAGANAVLPDPSGIYIGGVELVSVASTQLQIVLSHSNDLGGSPTIAGCCVGKTDIVVRIQRETAANSSKCSTQPAPLGCYILEVFDLRSSYHASANSNITAIGSNWAGRPTQLGGGTSSFAWLEWFDSTVAVGTPPDTADAGTGNLGSYKFENNLTDGSGKGNTLTGGSVTYGTTPVYGPQCNGGTQQTFRAGSTVSLTGAAGLALNGLSNTLTEIWQQTAGPRATWISGQRTFTPTIFLPSATNLPGTSSYIFQLTLTDTSGVSASCIVKDGAVATDSNGVVITTNSTVDGLIKQQVRWGSHTWPWFDDRSMAAANLELANVYNLAGVNGGVACTSNNSTLCYFQDWWVQNQHTGITSISGTTITGSGTTFKAAFACPTDNSSPAPAGVPNPQYSMIAFEYGTAPYHYRMAQVRTCVSDTQLTIDEAWDGTLGAPTGRWAADLDVHIEQWGFPTSNAQANYYDNVAAFYTHYFRSGIDDYLTAARALADRFWQSPYIDQGNAGKLNQNSGWAYNTGRQEGSLGMVLRALDKGDVAPAGMWAGLRNYWQNAMYQVQVINANVKTISDVRENGFEVAKLAYCAQFDPTYFDSYTGQTCGTAIATIMSSQVSTWKNSDGAIVQYYGSGPASPRTGQKVNVTSGSTTVTCDDSTATATCNWAPRVGVVNTAGTAVAWVSGNHFDTTVMLNGWGITINNVVYLISSCASSTACTLQSSAGTQSGVSYRFAASGSLSTFTNSWIWFLNLGFPTNVYGDPISNAAGESVIYAITGGTGDSLTLATPYVGANASKGWATADGGSSGVQFLGFGAQLYMEGIMSDALDRVARATAISDPTSSAVARSLSSGAADYIRVYGWRPSHQAYYYGLGTVNCPVSGTPVGTACDAGQDPATARTQNSEAMTGIMARYTATGLADAKTNADAAYNAMWAKPGTCGSDPACNPDGTYLTEANDGATYMTWGPAYLPWKWFGLFFGVSLGPSWPASRIGGLDPSSTRTFYQSFKLSSVANADHVVVTVTDTTGGSVSTTCSSSPCAVLSPRIDQAALTVRLTYKSAGGATLAVSSAALAVTQ